MNDTGIVDTFFDTFTSYINSGFGLLGGEIGFLSSTLIAIDVTIAGLFWAWGTDEDVIQRLVKKTLYIGAFAFIIGNFQTLATILFESFAGLGLKASGDSLSLAELMKPGTIAAKGLDAAQPLIDAAEAFSSLWAVFANLAIVVVLLLSYLIVILAFFFMAGQVFITLLEFKLVSLAGFVLLPFAFWNRTAFMAEKVLGHIVSSGIKVLVLAVIIGIGTTLFSQFTVTIGPEPNARQVLAIALGALTLLGFSIFGPGIANGIVSGGPQLGMGAAAGTVLAAGGALVGGAAAARLGVGAAAAAIGGTARGAAFTSGAASSAYALCSAGKTGAAAVAGGAGGIGKAAAGAAMSPLRKAAASLKDSYRLGGRAAVAATGGTISGGAASPASSPNGPPAWAAAMKHRQTMNHGATVAAHTLRGGDGGGGGASVDLSQKD